MYFRLTLGLFNNSAALEVCLSDVISWEVFKCSVLITTFCLC